MEVLGLAQEHPDDAMAEVARHLMAMGTRLVYGGDLRPKGFTELLIEPAIRHRRGTDDRPEHAVFTNYFPRPVHVSLSPEEVNQRREAVEGLAELIFLTVDGREMSFEERMRSAERDPAEGEWAEGPASMRRLVNGLDFEENRTLATAIHVEQAVTLVLSGLLRGRGASRP